MGSLSYSEHQKPVIPMSSIIHSKSNNLQCNGDDKVWPLKEPFCYYLVLLHFQKGADQPNEK